MVMGMRVHQSHRLITAYLDGHKVVRVPSAIVHLRRTRPQQLPRQQLPRRGLQLELTSFVAFHLEAPATASATAQRS